MPTPITKDHLDQAVQAIGTKIEGVEARLSESIRGMNEHVTKSQADHTERLVRLETKMDAVLDEVSTRRELHNLIRELKSQGIQLDEQRIIASRSA